MSKEELKKEDIQETNEEIKEESKEEKVIEELKYDVLLDNLIGFSKNVGQHIWITDEEDGSKKINIVRILSDGKKQMYSIVLAEEKELIFK